MYSIELLKGQPLLVRFGEDHQKYGDTYNGTAIIEIVDGVALIKGLTKMPPKSWVEILFAELRAIVKSLVEEIED